MPKIHHECFVKYLDHLGNDLTVVNAARVSFAKKHEEFDEWGDTRLIRYLAENDHWTPFGQPQIQMHLKIPIFVARQLMRTNVGIVWNEVSRRYVDDEPEFFLPKMLRKKDKNKKQGSKNEPVEREAMLLQVMELSYEDALDTYNQLIEGKVAPELARIVLPVASYTELHATGSLYTWARIYKQRIDSHAQVEIQELATQIGDIVYPLFPVSWLRLIGQNELP